MMSLILHVLSVFWHFSLNNAVLFPSAHKKGIEGVERENYLLDTFGVKLAQVNEEIMEMIFFLLCFEHCNEER